MQQLQRFGAEPRPASLENIPLLAPCKITAPIPPPIAEEGLNASLTIIEINPGISLKFNAITTIAINKYPTAITGTITSESFVILLIPPKNSDTKCKS